MCNLYANTLAPTLMRQLFNVRADNDQLGNAEPLTAIFPKGTAPIVALDEDGNRVLRNTHWGFVLPQTSKKTGKPSQLYRTPLPDPRLQLLRGEGAQSGDLYLVWRRGRYPAPALRPRRDLAQLCGQLRHSVSRAHHILDDHDDPE